MNLTRLFRKYGTTGVITRTGFDKTTGLQLTPVSRSVKMAVPLRTPENRDGRPGNLPMHEIDVLIENGALLDLSFPLPVKKADVIEVNNLRLSVKFPLRHVVRGWVVWVLKTEGL